jgi:hypothetical protein
MTTTEIVNKCNALIFVEFVDPEVPDNSAV